MSIVKKCNFYYNQIIKTSSNYMLDEAFGQLFYNDTTKFNGDDYDAFYEWDSKLSNIVTMSYNNYDIVDNIVVKQVDNDEDHTDIVLFSKNKNKIKNYISKLESNNSYFSYSTEALIPGNNLIPTLYLVVGKLFNYLNKQDSKYPRLNEAISLYYSKIVKGYGDDFAKLDDEDREEIGNLIEKNKSKINSINSFITSNPKYLGSGSDGMAFDIGNNYVLKLSSDDFSNKKTKESLDLLWSKSPSAKTEMITYDFGEISSEWITIYYSIIPKMKKPKTDNLKEVFVSIVGQIRSFNELKSIKDIKEPESYNLIKLISGKIELFILNKFSNYPYFNGYLNEIKEDNNLNKNWLNEYIEEIIIKHITGRGDLHLGNLGIVEDASGNHLRYFDPSYKKWENEINY